MNRERQIVDNIMDGLFDEEVLSDIIVTKEDISGIEMRFNYTLDNVKYPSCVKVDLPTETLDMVSVCAEVQTPETNVVRSASAEYMSYDKYTKSFPSLLYTAICRNEEFGGNKL